MMRRPRLEFDEGAEGRARELLRAAAGEEAHRMYVELGFVAVERDGYGYLLYPQRPVVAYEAEGGELLSEYCVRFPDHASGARLPDADDVLAKWLGLQADERRLIGTANMDPPGRQLDPDMVRRDIAALRRWRASRPDEGEGRIAAAGRVPG
jgi:hypothetical protein